METHSPPSPHDDAGPLLNDAAIDTVAAVLTGPERRVFLERARPAPTDPRTRVFLTDLCLGLGALFAGAAVLFFFAANWQELGRFAKLGSLASLFTACAAGAFVVGLDKPVGRALQVLATAAFGSLLGVYGQIYQAEADAWQLFFWWALLLAPWTLLSRWPAPWLFSVLLLDLSLLLFEAQEGRFDDSVWIFLLSAAWTGGAWILWETLSRQRAPWLGRRLGPWILAAATYGALLPSCLEAILDPTPSGRSFLALPVMLLLVAFGLTLYRRRYSRGIFVPAVALACLLTLSTAFLFKLFDLVNQDELAGLFFMGSILLIKISLATRWLRRLHRSAAEAPTGAPAEDQEVP